MRISKWLGRLLLLAMLAAFAVPGVADAKPGHRGRGHGHWKHSRVVVYDHGPRYAYYGYRPRYVHYHDGHCGHVVYRERVYYPDYPVYEHYPRYPRRGSVTVGVHIPF